jgi:hypothetical protein
MIIKLLVVLLSVIFIASFWFPIKLAVKKQTLKDKEYLICKKVTTTGFEWIAVEGTYSFCGYVRLEGKVPLEEYRNFYPSVRCNQFVCYGNVIGEDIFDGDKYLIFNVERWDVLYPVQRESFIPKFMQPKYGFTIWDTFD